ncbi:MAG: PadR family transcriptional regulator [Ktedonobacteraceae bacterium]|nr:PadR family transcriptional regulator [Ktedonobacteraceae bacterium]
MYSDILILVMLANNPMHGYEIKKRVEIVLGGSVTLNNKVLYPTLKRFEEMEAVRREVVRQEGKPDRHLYSLTDHGRELIQMLLQDASPDVLRNDSEFLVRVSLFNLVEPEVRLEILSTRAEIVRKSIAHLQEMKMLAHERNADTFAEEVITFNEQQELHELTWIEALMQKARQV